jgi:putative SOS response-associated peptidase YedK
LESVHCGRTGTTPHPVSGFAFVVITTDANELVAQIHNRMPLILATGDYVRWLSDDPDPRDLLRPFPADDADVADLDSG